MVEYIILKKQDACAHINCTIIDFNLIEKKKTWAIEVYYVFHPLKEQDETPVVAANNEMMLLD